MYTFCDIRFLNVTEIRAGFEAGSFPVASLTQEERKRAISLLMEEDAADLAWIIFDQSSFTLDLYELTNLGQSFFSVFTIDTPATERNIAFCIHVLSKTENISDEVSNETLMGYFMGKGVDPVYIQCLIGAGYKVNYINGNTGQNYLHQIIQINWHIISNEKKFTYMYLLAEAGIDINARDNEGNTPLILAVKDRNPDFVYLLMERGADANEPNNTGCTAYYYAISHGERVVIFDLLRRYAQPDFELVNRYGEVYFLSFMQKMTGREDEMQLLPRLIEAGASFSQTMEYKGEPVSGIHYLAQKATEVLKYVLDAGFVDIHEKDNQGNTLLHKVCAADTRGNSEAAKDVYRKVKLLLEAGADAGDTNDNNNTPLMLAMQDDAKGKTVELLLAAKNK